MENEKYYSEPFNRVAAWVDLLLMANVKDSVVYIRGVEVKVKRGQVAISEVELSKRWKIGRKLVRRYLGEFEMAQQITQQKNRRTHLISITNYEKFQDAEQQKEQQRNNSGTTGKRKVPPITPLKKTPTIVGEKESKENTLTGVKEKVAACAATLTKRKKAFYDSLVPYLYKYGKEMLREFYDYWSEMNPSRTKMKFEQQPTWEVGKRLATWARNEKNYTSHGNNRTDNKQQRDIEAANIVERLLAEDGIG